MKILITGSNGLLGQKLVKLCLSKSIDFLATSTGENRNPDCPMEKYSELDITNQVDINRVFTAFQPSAVIHTAAMTNVDQCEEDQMGCHQVMLWEPPICLMLLKS